MIHHRKPPSQTWRTFLENQVRDMVAVGFFVVATLRLGLLYCFLVLRHNRRRVVHFSVTPYPTARWTAQQVVEVFPFDEAPRFLIRDHGGIYGQNSHDRIRHPGIEEVIIAYRSPWQPPYVERLIGSIRRECLDHVIVFSKGHLRRILTSYFAYYHESRAHLSLDRNAPVSRRVEHPSEGRVIAILQVGGLHYRYTRAARGSDAPSSRGERPLLGRSAPISQDPPVHGPSGRLSALYARPTGRAWSTIHRSEHPG
jgi:hypothetical protein